MMAQSVKQCLGQRTYVEGGISSVLIWLGALRLEIYEPVHDVVEVCFRERRVDTHDRVVREDRQHRRVRPSAGSDRR